MEDGNIRIIKILKDIELLKKKLHINREALQGIEEYFKNVYNNIGKLERKTIDEFSLKDCGIIVYIEDGDNVWDLENLINKFEFIRENVYYEKINNHCCI
ncbi:hypothetical protein [Clostridium kluyveri]|uniref:hypothetical protein n=1 Tax=Clostridium kluyveri TaxID=1534 RepID=UPI001FA86BA0|nr:hypothetical protein [Clostridium kluyveri]